MCANFMIVEGMEIKFQPGSEKMLFAAVPADYSEPDEEPKKEAFLIKFKNKEIATEFKSIFDAQLKAGSPAGSKPPSQETKTEPTSLGSLEQFKPKGGSWECDACLVRNAGEVNICVACESSRPGFEPEKREENKPKFSFGIPTSSGAAAPSKPETTGGFNFSVKQPTAAPPAAFTFGAAPGAAGSGFSFNVDTTKPLFTFGTGKADNAGADGQSFTLRVEHLFAVKFQN